MQNANTNQLKTANLIDQVSYRAQNLSSELHVNPELNDYNEGWFDMFWNCFGVRGAVVLAWWLGALNAGQIRQLHKSYLFLELSGEAGSGKSTLVELLWKLIGRTGYEGFDPSRTTKEGLARNFSQAGKLPSVLLETDREFFKENDANDFDWEELKAAYNGRSVRSIAQENDGNDTLEQPFRKALLIVSNNTVNASEPMLQRLGHVHLTREHQTPATTLFAQQLMSMPVEQLSGFQIKALQREPEILKLMDERTCGYEQQLLALPGIRTVRVAENHAQLRSLVDALGLVVPLNNERANLMHAEISRMAQELQQAINYVAADH